MEIFERWKIWAPKRNFFSGCSRKYCRLVGESVGNCEYHKRGLRRDTGRRRDWGGPPKSLVRAQSTIMRILAPCPQAQACQNRGQKQCAAGCLKGRSQAAGNAGKDHAPMLSALELSLESMARAIFPSSLKRFMTAALTPGPDDAKLLALMS